MQKRFILIDPNSGFIFGDRLAATPADAARIVDIDLGITGCSYVELYTCDDMSDSYLVYDATGSALPEVDNGQDQQAMQQARELPFVGVVQRRD